MASPTETGKACTGDRTVTDATSSTASGATADFRRCARNTLDGKTKPPGALGRLEDIAAQIAEVQRNLAPTAERCRLTVFAADHGIAEAGVSAYPQQVTRQMLKTFLAGGAASNVMASALGVEFVAVDAGVKGTGPQAPRLVSARIGNGTANSLKQSAMSTAQYRRALHEGHAIGTQPGHDAACYGEMGIGNTSSASLVAAKLLGVPVDGLIGRGTGLDDDGLARKRRILEAAATRTPAILPPEAALTEYGGFETVMLTGAMMGAAETGKLVLVDGFIATVSALAALRMNPEVERHLVFAHQSAESGHRTVLDAIGARPLLDMNLRLGEGTGALLAWPLVRAAAAILRNMASFESAGVAGKA